MNAPLYNKLIQYSEERYPFHMPGHKFGKFGEMKELKLYLLDATEASGLDNLYEAEGVIEEAMKLMAEFYGSKESIFLTNGSTAGILTSILAVCNPGDKLLIARNCHHSVWSGLILAGVVPIYISPAYDEDKGIIGEIKLENVREVLEKHPDVKGALIVSPTYEGIVSDIKGIAGILHENDKILIVDEAHGSHFILSEDFPDSSISEGADLVIHSMHKTLPTLTQSALLHICTQRITKEKVIGALKMVQTSSPSYVMMAVMDHMRAYLEKNKEQVYKDYILPLINIRKNLERLKYLELLDEDINRYDRSKIIIMTNKTNIDGYELAKRLEDEYGLGVEAAQDNWVILMTTVADDIQTLERLEQALIQIDNTLNEGTASIQTYQYINQTYELGRSPREVHFSHKKWLDIEQCIGKVCGKNVMLYPPGIPLVCIGEVINERHIEVITKVKDKVLGTKQDNGQLQLYIETNDRV